MKRGWLVLVAGLLALLALLGGWRGQAGHGGADLALAAPAAGSRVSAVTLVAVPPPASVPRAAPARADAPWKMLPLELCGAGTVTVRVREGGPPPLPGDAPPLPPHLGEYALEAARHELVAALAAGPPRWQAAAALMSGNDETLRRVALGGTDPVALAWAAARCRGDSACGAEPLARWLALEPDNALPWLQLWQSQPARREEALAGLRRATRFRAGWANLADTTLQALPAHVLPYLQLPLIVEAIGIEAALPDPGPFTILELCPASMERGSTRQADCDAWARLLLQGDTLIAQGLGVRLGERLGWPPERTEPLRQSLRDLSGTAVTAIFDLQQPYGCDGVRRTREWVRRVSHDGEVAALRAFAQKKPGLAGE